MPELKEAAVTWMQLIVAVEEGRLITDWSNED